MRIDWSLRAVVLFGIVIALPLLAVPLVARWLDERLYGSPPADFGPAAALSVPLEAVIQPVLVERVSPAVFEDPNWSGTSEGSQRSGLDGAGAPPLAPLPAFEALTPSAVAAADSLPEDAIDEQTLAQLQQIRQRLEELGAEYVIVEATESTGRYRFHCRMTVDAKSPFTRPFESTSGDPLAAGQQVLREVEAWRTAALEKSTRQK